MTFEEFFAQWHNKRNYITVMTSGSTGDPKVITLAKEFMRRSARRTNNFFGITSRSRLHSCISPDFIGGKMMGVRADLSGATLTWENPSNQPLGSLRPSDRIDLLAVVPSQMLHILENQSQLPEIGNIIIGGSAIHPALRKKISGSGLNCWETYGMTETASHIALRKVMDKELPFEVLPGIEVTTNEGCLKIEFQEGERVQTNDLAEIESPGKFYIRGRRDDVIISGGRKINPLEVEEKIRPFVEGEFFLVGQPDEKWGQRVVMVVEKGFNPLEIEDFRGRLEGILQGYEIPKEIKVVDKLSHTSSGKLKRELK
ncbi:MAG: AMP-binding protein [Muribaculaceae bacterium]|nr:AMP-binding protein [Muribaculaceae bacterium]